MSEPPLDPIEAAAATMRMMPQAKRILVQALLACPSMSDSSQRNALVSELPKTVQSRIKRSNEELLDVTSMVEVALNFEGGLASLVAAVRYFEGDSVSMAEVDRVIGELGRAARAPYFGTQQEVGKQPEGAPRPRWLWLTVGVVMVAIFALLMKPLVDGIVLLVSSATWPAVSQVTPTLESATLRPITTLPIASAIPSSFPNTEATRPTPSRTSMPMSPADLTLSPTETLVPAVLGSLSVAMGDLDNDHDLDIFLGKGGGIDGRGGKPDEVWLNQGGTQGGVIGLFRDSGQRLGNASSRSVSLGDINNDGYLDALTANAPQLHVQPWLNDGNGFFRAIHTIGQAWSQNIALGDLDADGDLDGVVGNDAGIIAPSVSNEVWLNFGGLQGATPGTFGWGQTLSGADSIVALGDLDNDGDLDTVISNGAFGLPENINRVWLNDGQGAFSMSEESLGSDDAWGVVIGDIDNDGDLDVLFFNDPVFPFIWLNDGKSKFTPSHHSPGNSPVRNSKIALGDLDNDGDLDAFTIKSDGVYEIWRNGSRGEFDIIQRIDESGGSDVALGDTDKDGDLDAYLANGSLLDKLWINDGGGKFTDSKQHFVELESSAK